MASVEYNKDGSAIIKVETFKLNGEEHSRVTVPPLRGRHMRKIGWSGGAEVAIGKLVDLAAEIIEPAGSIDSMSSEDALFCATVVADFLGGRRQTGDSPSE